MRRRPISTELDPRALVAPRAPYRMRALVRLVATVVATAMFMVVGFASMSRPAHADAYDPATDPYSMKNVTTSLGASAWWKAGYTGAGVDVAVIDTGVTSVPGLDAPGKIVYGPDLSLESQARKLRYLDTNGHGTFMAGLIAGHDAELASPYDDAPASAYAGVAPDARILSVKVGVADGGVDVSQVIAAIDWVVQHRYDNGMNVGVINLSYGTNSTQPYMVDPLAYAAEQAWKKGIVVVAAAGNSGYVKGACLADPAYDPYVIAVGGADTMGNANNKDDRVGPYSSGSSSPTCRNPDFVAPGSHLQGLRVPNSYLDQTHPGAVLDGEYFRGTGTSEAAALVSGAAALVLQRYPDATPDKVKNYLASQSMVLGGSGPDRQGQGEVALKPLISKSLGNFTQRYPNATGIGSLELSRGTDHLTANGVTLSGEQDIFGRPFDSAAMAALEAAGISWSDGVWNGSTWSGSTWSGSTWSGSTWSGNTWSGSTWSGNTWSGSTWSGSTWSGNTWSGSTWSGSTWSGSSWSGNTWSGSTWSGSDWMGATWD